MSIKLENSWLDKQTGISIYIAGNDKEDEHCHEFMEIQYVEKGELSQIINGKEYICKAGDFMFFYVGDKHSYSASEKASLINVIFSPDLLNQMKLNKYFPVSNYFAIFAI